jgi:hypothetical protein
MLRINFAANFLLNLQPVHTNNFLDDEFAVDLSMLLEDNPILYKVDISRNPIGPSGG